MEEIVARPIPPIPLPFTGERLTSEHRGQTEIEHLHRYLLARGWCRGKDVLDVASGEGYGTALLAQVARTVIGLEIDGRAIEHAGSSYNRANVSYIKGDARSIPIADSVCDIVVSFETIQHFGEQKIFLEEVHRVLRPGGLFIVSTPDRNSYSPSDTHPNPNHFRELTSAQFDGLLRARFLNVSTLFQRPIFGSVMLPDKSGEAMSLCFERSGAAHFEAWLGLARPQHVVAFASDASVVSLPPHAYFEADRLGIVIPSEAEAQVEPAQSEPEARCKHATPYAVQTEDRAEEEREAQFALERTALAAEAQHVKTELAAARGEVKGLVAANEAGERACAALRDELRLVRAGRVQAEGLLRRLESELEGQRNRSSDVEARLTDGEARLANADVRLADAEARQADTMARLADAEARHADTDARLADTVARLADAEARRADAETRLADAEARHADAETRLANTFASHSWRVTAPLRRISRAIYRRP